MHTIAEYFPGLSEKQLQQFALLEELYAEWNKKINVISRQDMANVFEHHILFSAGISEYFTFQPATRIMDAGTGGGFPGIPLAIVFPGAEFCLVDSIAKKIRVVEAICHELGLNNVSTITDRFENIMQEFDFITGRAVMPLPAFYKIMKQKISPVNKNPQVNGIIYLKGGDVEEELKEIDAGYTIYQLSEQFSQPFFITKKIIHIFPSKSHTHTHTQTHTPLGGEVGHK